MSRLPRLTYYCLILISAVSICASATAYGQTLDARPKETGSISGRATIGSKGAPGIAIAAYGVDLNNIAMNSRRATAQVTTDSEGRYRLFGLPAGTYQVMALAPTFASGDPISLSSFGPNSGISKSIVLAPAENVEDIDLKLVRGGVITGRIKDADGKPVVEQRVALAPVDEKGAPARVSGPPAFNSQMYATDDRGVYRVYGLPAGHYKVSVGTDPSRGGMSIGSHVYYPLTFFGDVTDLAKATVVELSEGGETGNIDIQVGRRGETYTATGRIIDADSGQPIVGVRFGYGPAPKNQPYFSGFSVGTATNASGEFRIEGLEPGRYGVSVSSDFEVSSVYSDPAFFEVTEGDVSNIEVKAVRGLSISGVVITDAITSKEVLAQLGSQRITAGVASTAKPQTFSSGSSLIAGDGSFSISGLRPGRANFYVSAAGNPGIRGLVISRVERGGVDVTQALELQAGQSYSDLRVVLIYGTGTIRGTVKFENGTPPPTSRIYVSARREGSSTSNYGAAPDARGRFVIANLAAGTYEVTLNVGFAGPPPPPPQRRAPPPKQFVTVADDAEAQITFTVDLKPVEGGP